MTTPKARRLALGSDPFDNLIPIGAPTAAAGDPSPAHEAPRLAEPAVIGDTKVQPPPVVESVVAVAPPAPPRGEAAVVTGRQAAVRVPKTKATVLLPTDLWEAIRNTVVHLSGPPARLTLAQVAEVALRKELARLEAEYNTGKPFPDLGEAPRGGRPVRG